MPHASKTCEPQKSHRSPEPGSPPQKIIFITGLHAAA
jgi:hypothetical protein